MVELHGWLTLRESTSEEDDRIIEIANDITDKIKMLEWNSENFRINSYNGQYYIGIDLHSNRKDKRVEDVFNILEYILKKAVGSYGIVYMHDDEDVKGKDNEFVAYVIARGSITEKKDSFLSPYIPVVEDEE